MSNSVDDINNEIMLLIYSTDVNRDFDKLYIENNFSSVYHYKLKAFMHENPKIFSIVDVFFNLVDVNDNFPSLINYNSTVSFNLHGTLYENYAPNTLVNIDENYLILRVNDIDFSKEFGVKSLYCFTNDTRFYVDNEFISTEIARASENVNILANGISLLVRVKDGHESQNLPNHIFSINITCQDNYFDGNGMNFKSTSVMLAIQMVPDTYTMLSFEEQKIRRKPTFEHEVYTFNINESWTGFIGKNKKYNTL